MLLYSMVLLIVLKIKYCWCYQINWGDYRQTPQEIMVDVVNELGVKLLAIHNEHNDNNIAISPYGALSVLIALGEGLQGDAVDEILHAAHIPHDVSIIRIGVRDIHRHLQSYFIPDEGFLAGLLLSHDNVTLNREYEDILRFYGFDIESFNSALYPDFITTTTTVKPELTTDSTTVRDNEETTITTTSASTTDSVVKTTTEITTETPPVGKIEITTETVESTTFSPSTTETEITTSSTEMAPTSTVIDTTTTEIVDETTELSTETPTTETMGKIKRSAVDYAIARYYDEHAITRRPPPVTDLTFLVNEQSRESNTNFMVYDTILPFFYISHLDTFALRFPLDSSRYYLLLLLPAKDRGIDKLICNLRLEGNLRYIIKNLKYTHVRAIIPSFMLKGYVVLTSTFQKLGVRKVFEPRHADFTPMTMDRGIYVTNIEQAITVTIRNYMNPDEDNHLRYLHHYEPVLFKADHPFLYFVIDADIHVSLMAGKIVNPLNSRIK